MLVEFGPVAPPNAKPELDDPPPLPGPPLAVDRSASSVQLVPFHCSVNAL